MGFVWHFIQKHTVDCQASMHTLYNFLAWFQSLHLQRVLQTLLLIHQFGLCDIWHGETRWTFKLQCTLFLCRSKRARSLRWRYMGSFCGESSSTLQPATTPALTGWEITGCAFRFLGTTTRRHWPSGQRWVWMKDHCGLVTDVLVWAIFCVFVEILRRLSV